MCMKMSHTINNIAITAIASALPQNILAVKDMGFGAAEVERIIASSGVRNIRIAGENTCTSDLCVFAAEKLFAAGNIDRSTVDAVVFVSQTFDYKLPATSCIIQDRLGLSTDVVAFDIAYGCSGYVYGLLQAAMLISTGVCQKVLLCAGEISTHFAYPKDRSTRVLFGDAGTATIIEKGAGSMPFHFFTDGSGSGHIIVPAGGCRMPYSAETAREYTDEEGNTRTKNHTYMNGFEILNFAIKEVPKSIDGVLKEAVLSKDDIDVFALHQANEFMLNHLRKKMKIPAERLPIMLQDTGNTSSASIPLALTLAVDSLRVQGSMSKVLCCGFGVGLSIASTIADLSETVILPPFDYTA